MSEGEDSISHKQRQRAPNILIQSCFVEYNAPVLGPYASRRREHKNWQVKQVVSILLSHAPLSAPLVSTLPLLRAKPSHTNLYVVRVLEIHYFLHYVRRQAPGGDWAVLKLGVVGEISRLVVDTNHFKGNFPESVLVEACLHPDAATMVRINAQYRRYMETSSVLNGATITFFSKTIMFVCKPN